MVLGVYNIIHQNIPTVNRKYIRKHLQLANERHYFR